MSGHSKWNNIKRKKEKTDGARAKIFTKIGRELAVAVKEGGSADPNANSKLKDCISKAKALNVPNDNIERIIKKDYNKYEAKKICEELQFKLRELENITYNCNKRGIRKVVVKDIVFVFRKRGQLIITLYGLGNI
jgi:transcriptional/translational regulatory protein YebC/TACO1